MQNEARATGAGAGATASTAATITNVNVSDLDSAEARARRKREAQANLSASEKLKNSATVVVAVVAGVIVSFVKFVAAFITGSSAMFSEGIHSMVDAINDSLLLIGNKLSQRAPDVQHPFGYGQEVYFYSHAVALVIFVLGGGFAIYEGMQNVMAGGHPVANPVINYVVLVIGIIFEGISLSVAVRTVNKARGDRRIIHYIRESKSPTNITVFLEDTAAVLGMAVALVGNIASQVTGNFVIDAWASVIIGCIMAAIAVVLLRKTRGLLIGEGLQPDEVREIVFLAESDPATVKCGRVLSLYLGPEDLLLNLDVTFRENLPEGGVLQAIDRIEAEIIDEFPQTTRIFIEAESLNQVYRQRRDRKLAYEAYKEDKQLEEQLAAMRERDEKLVERFREQREDRRRSVELKRAEWRERMSASQREPAIAGTPLPSAGAGQLVKLFGEVPRVEGARVVLDRVVEADAEALCDLIGNAKVQRYLPTYLFEKQRSDVDETIQLLYGELFENEESLILAVRVKESGELAGLAEFYGYRDSLHKVSVGYRLRESWWGKGLATEAVQLMVGYLYGQTDIEIITASTMVENAASAHVLEKCGFICTAQGVAEDWGFEQPTIVDKWFC